MVNVSQGFRDKAAKALRASRNAAAGSPRDVLVYVARTYKALAHDEEMLRGEPQKSRKHPPKK
jgi:hypothetical protein